MGSERRQVATPTVKACPACGNRFPCTTAGPCWCMNVPTMPITPGLDCLCPTCLPKAERGPDLIRLS